MPDGGPECGTPDECVDALDRYERTLDAQLALLGDIDDKAANVVRYTPLLVGVIFTALSLASHSTMVSLSGVGVLSRAAFLVGLAGFVTAICAATVTYTSSVKDYGPDAEYGYTVARGDVNSPIYERVLLVGYASAVSKNRDVINANARRFRWAIVGLLVGVLYSSLAGALTVLGGSRWVTVGVTLVVTLAATYFTYSISTEYFLVLDRGVSDNG